MCRAGVGFGDAEGDVEITGSGAGEVGLFQSFIAELHDGFEAEHREVQSRAAVHGRSGRGDLTHHDGRVGDAATAAAVLLRDGHTDPAAVGHRPVELPREAVFLIARRPILVREPFADVSHALPDQRVILALREIHRSVRPVLEAEPMQDREQSWGEAVRRRCAGTRG